jgi:hypothetical protein
MNNFKDKHIEKVNKMFQLNMNNFCHMRTENVYFKYHFLQPTEQFI